MLFYFDEKVKTYEDQFQWDQSLVYLESMYLQSKEVALLNTIVGYSWFYLVEGPIISREFRNDTNILPLVYWGKYIDIGMNVARDNPFFSFIAGYTLLLNGEYFDYTHVEIGFSLMQNCVKITDNTSLRILASNFIQNTNSRKHIPLENGGTICSDLFPGCSLLDQYFREVYAI